MVNEQSANKLKRRRSFKKAFLTFFGGIIFAVLLFVLVNVAMEPASRSEFCSSTCHEMNTASKTWELSVHGANRFGIRVECVDCHLPPKEKFFTHVATKAYVGTTDVLIHFFGKDYDPEKSRQKAIEHMSNQTCLHCHDDLLARPGNSAARTAHMAVISRPDAAENKCVKCHEDAGHERKSKLFSQQK